LRGVFHPYITAYRWRKQTQLNGQSDNFGAPFKRCKPAGLLSTLITQVAFHAEFTSSWSNCAAFRIMKFHRFATFLFWQFDKTIEYFL
jgi:hypothetical protein